MAKPSTRPAPRPERKESDPFTAYVRALNRGETDEKYLDTMRRIQDAATGMSQRESSSRSELPMFKNGGMVRGTRPVQVSGKNFSGKF